MNRVDKDGGSVTVLAQDLMGPECIVVDGRFLYYTLRRAGTVVKLSLEDHRQTILASGQATPSGIAVDSTHVYWVNYASGEVARTTK